MSDQSQRYKIFMLGWGGVGKSTIIHKYLYGNFREDYVETVEELYTQQYTFDDERTYIDFFDTAGSISFPAMQQIYISKAEGFILVYSITNKYSFNVMKQIWEQIKRKRENILSIPCVVIGNYLDKEQKREVETSEAFNWACSENLAACFLETSAKGQQDVDDIFYILLQQFGNTRLEQTGQLRIRTANAVIQKWEVDAFRESWMKNKRMSVKKKITNSFRMTISNHKFQDTCFDDYKEIEIYRINNQAKDRFENTIVPSCNVKSNNLNKGINGVHRHEKASKRQSPGMDLAYHQNEVLRRADVSLRRRNCVILEPHESDSVSASPGKFHTYVDTVCKTFSRLLKFKR